MTHLITVPTDGSLTRSVLPLCSHWCGVLLTHSCYVTPLLLFLMNKGLLNKFETEAIN